jgi:translocator protein
MRSSIPERPMMTRRVGAVLGPLAAAVIGGLGSRNAPQVYRRLRKPPWAPPETVFGPVWTGLYVMIAAAGWRMAGRRTAPAVWTLHGSQLLLNAAWPWAFFAGSRKPASLIVITVLDAALISEVMLLTRRDRASAALLAPYLGWSLFATALNAAVSDPGEVH